MIVAITCAFPYRMVFFSCNGCGESLKKQKVEQHSYACSSYTNVSCIDCNVTFAGSEYRKHTKCVSEAERYQGHLYQGEKNKGAVKQNSWMEIVRDAAEKCKSNAALKGLLVRISENDNVPRKKAKFLNFIKNSMKERNINLVEQAWEAIETAKANENSINLANVVSDKKVDNTEKSDVIKPMTANDIQENKVHSNAGTAANPVRKRKRKRKDSSTGCKSQKSNISSETDIPLNTNGLNGLASPKSDLKKFKLSKTIHSLVLQKEEMLLKKLRRKVLMSYLEAYPYKTMEEASRQFEKKLRSTPGVCVENNVVKLKATEK